jgi:tetratricopeptide (TPR) repeat protein
MIFGKNGSALSLRRVLLGVSVLCLFGIGLARPPMSVATPELSTKPASAKKSLGLDDSFVPTPAADLALQPENSRKANALADFVEGVRLEENAEMENALAAYQRVLNFDPGMSELALRVAALLSGQGDYPRAIDVLKDAIKARPKEAGPYLQLALIYAKYLRKTEQAVKYANQAIALAPLNFETYQRLYEIEAAAGQPQKALAALDRAANVKSDDSAFWIRLGKLYATIVFKSDTEPKPEEIKRVNGFFDKAVAHAGEDPGVLKDVADYYAASQQI